MIQVILHVDAALGVMGQHGAGHKGIEAISQQQEPGFSRMRRCPIRHRLAVRGVGRVSVCMGLGSFKTLGQCGTAADHKQRQQ